MRSAAAPGLPHRPRGGERTRSAHRQRRGGARRLLAAAKAAGADLLVAGAFGHPRLREFIFGGATRTFLNADSPSLFLSH